MPEVNKLCHSMNFDQITNTQKMVEDWRFVCNKCSDEVGICCGKQVNSCTLIDNLDYCINNGKLIVVIV